MAAGERDTELIEKILDGLDRGDFADTTELADCYTYEFLRALFRYRNVLHGAGKLFEQIYHRAMAYGISRIQRKADGGEKISVAFLSYSAAQWPAEEVYRLLEQDERFEPYVVIGGIMNRDRESRIDSFKQTLSFFTENGYRVMSGHDVQNDQAVSWEELGGIPDILVHVSVWNDLFSPKFQIWNLPLRCLNLYIPYGIHTTDSPDGNFLKTELYNRDFCNMMWRLYTDSKVNQNGYAKYEFLKGENVVFSGYTKMDRFFKRRNYTEEERSNIWPVPAGSPAMKKIIIAPHFSLYTHPGVINFSTFGHNLWYFYYLAQKYQNEIAFVLKPHPNLRSYAVGTGLFSSLEEYDHYLALWEALPNAKVVQEGDYLEIFATSDGMIMDSASFIAEYLYTGRPCLFLTRAEQRFSELGSQCMKAHYQADGKDYLQIENFLTEVILCGKDEKQEIRREVFERVLDYQKMNGIAASEAIYRDFCRLFPHKSLNQYTP